MKYCTLVYKKPEAQLEAGAAMIVLLKSPSQFLEYCPEKTAGVLPVDVPCTAHGGNNPLFGRLTAYQFD